MSEKKRILIYVDDEKDHLILTKATLLDYFKVIGFGSPIEALKEMSKLQPAIILSDLNMPEMDGVEFLELAQQICPNAVRVMITGNSNESAVIAAIKRAGVFDFIKKPYDEDELIKALLKAEKHFLDQEKERQKKEKIDKPDLMEHKSWLHKITEQLRESLAGLPYRVSDRLIEQWSILIHLAMSAEKRYYHNTQHLFDIWEVKDPYERLAILFHDVVYAQVDKNTLKGTLPQITEILGPLAPNSDLKLKLPDPGTLPDPMEHKILYQVFGVKEGSELHAFNGMNEFLSARVAQKILGSTFSRWDTVQIMSCIELTIPFRPKDAEGKRAPDRLFDRLLALDLGNEPKPGIAAIESAVKRAVDVTNRDLWGFAAKDPEDFMNGTWKLILEGNLALQRELHSPRDYRTALEKSNTFLATLKPEGIFQRFRDFPADADWAKLMSQCQHNLAVSDAYFKAKIMAMGILEVLDVMTGGQGPVEILRGDIESYTNAQAKKLEDYLDLTIQMVEDTELNQSVVQALRVRSESTIQFDLKNSPLAMYVYTRLKKKEFDEGMVASVEFFKDQEKGFEFLKAFPRPLILSVLKAVAEVSSSRKVNILQIVKVLESYPVVTWLG